MKRFLLNFCSMCLLFTSPVCVSSEVPAGTFQFRCLDRHFLLSIQSSFLGLKTRFDFEDQLGLHVLSDQEATLCGYTVLINSDGDLLFRASLLACHVQQLGTDYHLHMWFVNLQPNGKLAAYPFQLHCSLQERWSPREIICEENYMEVSIHQLIVLNISKNERQTADESQLAVMFNPAEKPSEVMRLYSLLEAAALGYHISLHGSRLILRCPHSSLFSFFIKEKGVDLEVVRAAILYRVQTLILAVDVTVACSLNQAEADGSHLLWTIPYILSPLVHGEFRDRGVRIGVDGQALSESALEERRFKVELQEGRVEVRVPLAAHGGHIKSGIFRGQYSQSMSVDLFFTSQWEDDRWPLTKHHSFRLLKTPLIPQTPALTNNTVTSDGFFSVMLGIFAADVSLQKVTVDGGGDFITWMQSHQTQNSTDLSVSRLSHSNRSHSYVLSFPFSHPNIIPEYIGGGYKTFSFSFTFTLNISNNGEVFYHQATIEQSLEHKTPLSPRLEGKCTGSSLLVLLYHGAQAELQWELFLGTRKLDWELVEMGAMEVEAEEDYLTVDIPFNSPVMDFEELSLQGFVSGVEASVVDAESLKVEDRLVHKCSFPVREVLLCLPEGRMVAIVDTSHTIPPTQPNQTYLLDSGCVPMATDSARAMFSFSLDSCGTTVTTEGNFLLYENQISSHQDFLPLNNPVIRRDSPLRLTIQCRYPVNESRTLAFHQSSNSSLDLSPRRAHREAVNSGKKKWILSLEGQQNLNQVWIPWMLVSLLLLLLLLLPVCRGVSAVLTWISNR